MRIRLLMMMMMMMKMKMKMNQLIQISTSFLRPSLVKLPVSAEPSEGSAAALDFSPPTPALVPDPWPPYVPTPEKNVAVTS